MIYNHFLSIETWYQSLLTITVAKQYCDCCIMDYVILHNGISLSCRNHYKPRPDRSNPRKILLDTTISSLSHRRRSFLPSFSIFFSSVLFQLFQDWIFFLQFVREIEFMVLNVSEIVSNYFSRESFNLYRPNWMWIVEESLQVKIQRMPICFERKESTINARINSPWLRDTK